jgi:signal transduction histidine kinase
MSARAGSERPDVTSGNHGPDDRRFRETGPQTLARELDVRARRAAAFVLFVAILIYPSRALFDRSLAPGQWKTYAGLRILEAALVAAAYVALRMGRIRAEAFFYVAFLGMALDIAYMCATAPLEALSAYFLGFTTLFLAAAVLLVWHPVHSLAVLGLSIAALAGMNEIFAQRSLATIAEHGGFTFLVLAAISVLLTRVRRAQLVREIEGQLATQAAHHDLERQAEALGRSNRELERFARAVSHDLKTPIHQLGMAIAAVEASGDEAQRAELLARMRQTVDAAARIVDEILAEAKLAASPRPAPSTSDLREVYDEVSGTLTDDVRRSGGRIAADFSACSTMRLERGKLKSVLANLMTNAIKFRAAGRPLDIQVCSARERGTACLSITDNGVGIDLARDGDEIFRRYGRLRPEVEGSGLGLDLVKDIVEAEGGTVEVESRVGEGTTFRVRIPD